jgi:hypothetical protein
MKNVVFHHYLFRFLCNLFQISFLLESFEEGTREAIEATLLLPAKLTFFIPILLIFWGILPASPGDI